MPAFTVTAANVKGEPINRDGKVFKTIVLSLTGPGHDDPVLAEWFTIDATPLPRPGFVIEGDLTNDPKWGWKFKKASGFGGGGGGRPRDPKETAAIQRQHSQSVAVAYASLQHAAGKLPEGITREQLAVLIDWFQDDIERGVGRKS